MLEKWQPSPRLNVTLRTEGAVLDHVAVLSRERAVSQLQDHSAFPEAQSFMEVLFRVPSFGFSVSNSVIRYVGKFEFANTCLSCRSNPWRFSWGGVLTRGSR